MINKNHYIAINFLFCLIPISMMIGSFIVNLNIFLIIIFGGFFFKNHIISFKASYIDKIIIFFFIYVFFTLFFNYFENYINGIKTPDIIISKTFLYFRFFLFFLIIRILVEKKIINLSLFSYLCAICACLISFDIFFQFFFNKNIFGMVPVSKRHLSSIFAEELIAGGYLQKFSIFFFFIPLFWKINVVKKNLIHLIAIIIFSIAIILSGNRMPFLLFIFSALIYLLFTRSKKKIIVLFSCLVVSFYLILSYNQNIKTHFLEFYNSSINLTKSIFKEDMTKMPKEYWQKPYVTEFDCGIQIAKLNPYFGGGLRFYRTYVGGCNTHPHNYYLEIVADLGFFGLLIFLSIFLFLFKEIFLKKIKSNYLNINHWPFFLITCAEIFPIRTSGSLFTTQNSIIIFLSLAVLTTLAASNIPKKN